MSWDLLRAGWSEGWKQLQARASATWSAAVAQDPTGFAPRVQAFVGAMDAARADLDRVRGLLAAMKGDAAAEAQAEALERRWKDLGAGFYAEVRAVGTVLGAAPVLVVGGLVVGAAAIVWALAAWEYAENLRDETALFRRELEERVAASRDGRVLQSSTIGPKTRSVTINAGTLAACCAVVLAIAISRSVAGRRDTRGA